MIVKAPPTDPIILAASYRTTGGVSKTRWVSVGNTDDAGERKASVSREQATHFGDRYTHDRGVRTNTGGFTAAAAWDTAWDLQAYVQAHFNRVEGDELAEVLERAALGHEQEPGVIQVNVPNVTGNLESGINVYRARLDSPEGRTAMKQVDALYGFVGS
jgi:hypothetical protein